MTASQLANELEVSIRTVYRDAEALHAAGVPLFGQAGHAGGYELVDGYRTRLTGLSPAEAQALFVATAPGPAAELGLGTALAAALLKLQAALPAELATWAQQIGSRFHLDVPNWFATGDTLPHLRRIADAVWEGRALDIRYQRRKEPTAIDRRVEPYGLVLKAGCWYLVAGPDPRTYRIDRILEVNFREESVEPPDGFDLATFWAQSQSDFDAGSGSDASVAGKRVT